MDVKEEIEKALNKVKEKYGLDGLVVEIVKGKEASIGNGKIRIGEENPLKLIECITLHEAYHIIMKIDQTEDFKEKDKGNIVPYLKTKIKIWNKIKEDFPELSEKVNSCQEFFGHKID